MILQQHYCVASPINLLWLLWNFIHWMKPMLKILELESQNEFYDSVALKNYKSESVPRL